MATIDDAVIQECKKYTNGVTPEFYFYGVQMPAFWVQILLAGGLLGAALQKPSMVCGAKGTLYFVPVSMWSTTKFKETGAFNMRKEEIVNAKYRKFGPAHNFTLTLANGKKMRLVGNTLYRKLEQQANGIEQFKQFLNV